MSDECFEDHELTPRTVRFRTVLRLVETEHRRQLLGASFKQSCGVTFNSDASFLGSRSNTTNASTSVDTMDQFAVPQEKCVQQIYKLQFPFVRDGEGSCIGPIVPPKGSASPRCGAEAKKTGFRKMHGTGAVTSDSFYSNCSTPSSLQHNCSTPSSLQQHDSSLSWQDDSRRIRTGSDGVRRGDSVPPSPKSPMPWKLQPSLKSESTQNDTDVHGNFEPAPTAVSMDAAFSKRNMLTVKSTNFIRGTTLGMTSSEGQRCSGSPSTRRGQLSSNFPWSGDQRGSNAQKRSGVAARVVGSAIRGTTSSNPFSRTKAPNIDIMAPEHSDANEPQRDRGHHRQASSHASRATKASSVDPSGRSEDIEEEPLSPKATNQSTPRAKTTNLAKQGSQSSLAEGAINSNRSAFHEHKANTASFHEHKSNTTSFGAAPTLSNPPRKKPIFQRTGTRDGNVMKGCVPQSKKYKMIAGKPRFKEGELDENAEQGEHTREHQSLTSKDYEGENSQESILMPKVMELTLCSAWVNQQGSVGRHRLQSYMSAMEEVEDYIDIISDQKEGFNAYDRFFQNYIWSPYGLRSRVWNIILILNILFDIVRVPLLVFKLHRGFLEFMRWQERFVWTLVLPIGFITGYTSDRGEQMVQPTEVAFKYLKTWFVFDALSALLNWLTAFVRDPLLTARKRADHIRILEFLLQTELLVAIPRMIRIWRLGDLEQYVNFASSSPKKTLRWRLVKTSCGFFLCIHYITCIWYAIGYYFEGRTWLTDFNTNPQHLEEASISSLVARYSIPLHWATTQFLGNIEIGPTNVRERLFAACCLLFTYIYSAVFIGQLSSSMTQLHMLTGAADVQIATLRQFLRRNEVSQRLSGRVVAGAAYAMEQKQKHMSEDDVGLLTLISEPLMVEIHFEVYSRVLSGHPFFFHLLRLDSASVRRLCHAGVQSSELAPGDVLFQVGETPVEPFTFFIRSGTMLYLGAVERKSVDAGQCVCERFLWTDFWTYLGTLVSITNCTFACLQAAELQKLFMSSVARTYTEDYARAYVAYAQEAPETLDDVANGCFNPEEVARDISGGLLTRRKNRTNHGDNSQLNLLTSSANTPFSSSRRVSQLKASIKTSGSPRCQATKSAQPAELGGGSKALGTCDSKQSTQSSAVLDSAVTFAS